ncbi:hypothetical protein BH10ACI3_BH10ACI3_07380 [soil metagenome]
MGTGGETYGRLLAERDRRPHFDPKSRPIRDKTFKKFDFFEFIFESMVIYVITVSQI